MAMGLTFTLPLVAGTEGLFTSEAITFLADLQRRFGPGRRDLLAARARRQEAFDRGELPDFLPHTANIRNSDWQVAPIPPKLQRRWVEITGPTDRKMVINALNSGADCFMADCEDATSPTWENATLGQVNLFDAVRGTIRYEDAERGKVYALGSAPATLLVRPRGWHLDEAHVLVDGERMSGSLFDFGLFVFHNARAQVERGAGPYFYVPKLESHREAKLWDDVFTFAEQTLGLEVGTIKATVLIETLPAAFEMHEILWALRNHAAGLNCGRWDYIFSTIKTLRAHGDRVLPDRSEVGMTQPFMRAYSQLAIQTCHRRGAFAMGGMAAQIPIKGDEAANAAALSKVRADKEREAADGHDGTWVAHPALVPLARDVFAKALGEAPNQLHMLRQDVHVTAGDLLAAPQGALTEKGLHHNLRVGVEYLAAWLGGLGCVPLYNLMEDAATAEISRAQVWQWLHHSAVLSDETTMKGEVVTREKVEAALDCELAGIRAAVGDAAFERGHYESAAALFREMIFASPMPDFLTLAAYEAIVADGR